jgi:DNA (cytosine-5)-methyltransferase 1
VITIASFFSGVGGLELGLEQALDAQTVFQCERDPYALKILEQHWPSAVRHNDITTLRGSDIPHADVWCGGFPCQDISVAGKQEGINGSRSGLFFEWMRLVREVRPRFIVMENVPAILAGDNLGPVLGALAEAGYDAERDVLGAWQVGAPHRRDRWFIIAWRAELGRTVADADEGHQQQERALRAGRHAADHGCAHELADADGGRCEELGLAQHAGQQGARGHLADGQGARGRRDGPAGTIARELHAEPGDGDELGDGADAQRERLEGLEQAGPAARSVDRPGHGRDPGWWEVEPDVGRVVDGVPSRVDRLRCLGNAVVPACAYVIGARLRELIELGPQ